MKGWEDTTVKEVRTYLGLRFLMGLQSKRQMRDFWSRDPLMSSAIFPQTMSRDRFDQLTEALHFADNQAERQADDRLWKLRPVVDVPNKVASIDESLWAFKGRHQALQFVPNKRARRGIKVYKLCSSLGPEAGYTTYLHGDVPASMKAVIDLLERGGLMDKGYEVHTDNWYSSPSLFHHLQKRKTSAVRSNRKQMPTDLQAKGRGSVDFRSTDSGMLALHWLDRRPVTMLSTVHTSEMVALPPNHQGIQRIKPKVVTDYNNGMKGVDFSDQL
nr:piggyBac transposable element-derived protein 4-like [Penaeus vannamei]